MISALVYTKQRDNTRRLRALPASFSSTAKDTSGAGAVFGADALADLQCPRHSRTGATPAPALPPSQSQRSSPEQWRSISLPKALCDTGEEGPFPSTERCVPFLVLRLAGECFPHSTNPSTETLNHSWRCGQQRNLSDGTKRRS